MKSTSVSAALLLAALQVHAHGHMDTEDDPNKSYMQRHMETEHHITDFDPLSFFNLHDLNRDGILDHDELAAIYGVHHETSKQHSPDADAHRQKTEDILKQVLTAVDFNGDAVVTKSEFLVAAKKGGLPNFQGIQGLGHHYDEEGEYFLHHEELYHSNPEDQTEESYNHPEDIAHFAHHDEIEEREHVLEMKAQGLDADGKPLPNPDVDGNNNQKVFADWTKEAQRRGEWSGFKKPKDMADRLRPGVPWKFRTRGSYFGEF